jgi:hypothetical protein
MNNNVSKKHKWRQNKASYLRAIEKANALLKNGFIDKLNNKFEKLARNPISALRSLNDLDLNQILCWKYERKVKKRLDIFFYE